MTSRAAEVVRDIQTATCLYETLLDALYVSGVEGERLASIEYLLTGIIVSAAVEAGNSLDDALRGIRLAVGAIEAAREAGRRGYGVQLDEAYEVERERLRAAMITALGDPSVRMCPDDEGMS